MDDKEELTICGLWRLDADLSVAQVDDGNHLLERPVLEPRRQDLLFRRYLPAGILGLRLRHRARTLSNKRVFATTKQDPGVADGSTVDAEGHMWNAQLIGGELVRYAPDGSVERRIGMPVRNITSVIFGGDRLDDIYVTSMARVKHPAVHDLFKPEVRPQFGAGALYRIRGLGIRGLPEPRFAG